MVKTIETPAAEFKSKCLRILDEVHATGGSVIITKRGKQVAMLVPAPSTKPRLKGLWKDKVTVDGDIRQFNTASDWESNF